MLEQVWRRYGQRSTDLGVVLRSQRWERYWRRNKREWTINRRNLSLSGQTGTRRLSRKWWCRLCRLRERTLMLLSDGTCTLLALYMYYIVLHPYKHFDSALSAHIFIKIHEFFFWYFGCQCFVDLCTTQEAATVNTLAVWCTHGSKSLERRRVGTVDAIFADRFFIAHV